MCFCHSLFQDPAFQGGGNETQRGAALKVPAVQAHEGTSQGGKAVQPACGGPGAPSGPGGSGQGEMLFELKPELGSGGAREPERSWGSARQMIPWKISLKREQPTHALHCGKSPKQTQPLLGR